MTGTILNVTTVLIGSAVGLLLGGLFTELASWRWTLLVNVPIALGLAAA